MDLKQTYITVQPSLAKVNKYLTKTKKVAITQINPIIDTTDENQRVVQALRLHIEGPENQLKQFNSMIQGAGLLA